LLVGSGDLLDGANEGTNSQRAVLFVRDGTNLFVGSGHGVQETRADQIQLFRTTRSDLLVGNALKGISDFLDLGLSESLGLLKKKRGK
jgi:hypothetical protein